ncbi:MAG: hypothetical protein P9X24_01430 [Candidatus Hatepunaea meridiana]|nr:hypothetical protein [Candidatus Hatepunaea meridiana]
MLQLLVEQDVQDELEPELTIFPPEENPTQETTLSSSSESHFGQTTPEDFQSNGTSLSKRSLHSRQMNSYIGIKNSLLIFRKERKDKGDNLSKNCVIHDSNN